MIRASYERLIESLSHSFDVSVRYVFEFDLKEEDEQVSSRIGWRSTSRVVGWSLQFVETRPIAEVLTFPDTSNAREGD
jgi:hypothetical protein